MCSSQANLERSNLHFYSGGGIIKKIGSASYLGMTLTSHRFIQAMNIAIDKSAFSKLQFTAGGAGLGADN